MKTTIWLIVILIALGGLGYWYFNKGNNEIISPKIGSEISDKKTESSDPQAGQKVPKEFKFEASTDLKEELENVNPEVLDSDFTQLKTLIKDL